MAILSDVFLEDLAVGRLGIPKVEQLVQQFVYDDEIVAYALLFDFLEILVHDAHDLVQKHEDQHDVGVFLGRGHDVQVVTLDVRERALLGLQQGRQRAFLFLLHQQRHELLDDVGRYVAPVVPGYQHFAFDVQYVNRRSRHGRAGMLCIPVSRNLSKLSAHQTRPCQRRTAVDSAARRGRPVCTAGSGRRLLLLLPSETRHSPSAVTPVSPRDGDETLVSIGHQRRPGYSASECRERNG